MNKDCGLSGSLILNENIVLFGRGNNFKSDDTLDLVILLAKFFIYKCKVSKNIPRISEFKKYLNIRYETEKYISRVNMTYDKFLAKWYYWENLLGTEV